MCRMLKLVKDLKWYMCFAVLAGTLGFLCAQFIPILGGYAVLIGMGQSVRLGYQTICIILIVIALSRAVLKYVEQRTNHYIAFTLLAIIRDRVFQALRRLSPAKLEGRDKGDLISLITSDVELLEVFYAHTISPICIAVLTETIMCLYIGSFHPLLGVIALAAYVVIGAVLPMIISRKSGTLGDDLRRESGDLAAYMLENIRGLREIIQFGSGETRRNIMNERTDTLRNHQEKLSALSGSNLALANTLILIFDLVMLAAGGFLYQSGRTDMKGFLLPVIALMSSFGPVSALANLGTALQSTLASGARILSLIDEKPETEEITGKQPVSFASAEMDHVTFGYQKETVLKDFSASFGSKGIYGLVGPSGCGKSTILKLLMRFWKVKQGEVRISSRSVEEINTSDLRDMESYMTQSTELFKDTIAENIRIARLNATDEEIQAAAKKASIHDFIMKLPKGYDTEVGELGDTLSGGERQRIGLARIFLHGAPFVLLDEPTSNLDSLNEAMILKSLKEEMTDRTVLLVSHRLSTVRIADRIIDLEKEACASE